jgi:hypothetical protein
VNAGEHSATLRRDRWATRMFADPTLTGDLLLLALAFNRRPRWPGRSVRPQPTPAGTVMAGLLAGDREPPRRAWQVEVARMLGWPPEKVRWVLANDRPRYEPPWLQSIERHPCEGVMVRRDGPCGQPNSRTHQVIEYSPVDGTQVAHHFCSRHADQAAEFRARLPRRADCPRPAANRGGVLPRYFKADWPAIWRWASPGWEPPPDTPLPPGRPQLVLVVSNP